MRRVLRVVCAFSAVALCTAFESPSQSDPDALLARAFRNYFGQDYVHRVRMVTSSEGETGRELVMQIVRGRPDLEDRALIRFLEPIELNGAAYLVRSLADGSQETFVFLPRLGFARRVRGLNRSDPFFSTDLSIEDMEAKSHDEYIVKLGIDIDPACVELSMVPRGLKASSYDELTGCVEEIRGVFMWIDFIVKGQTRKKLVLDRESIREIEGRQIPFLMTMHDLRRGTRTVIETLDYSVVQSIPDRLFSIGNLRTGDATRDLLMASAK